MSNTLVTVIVPAYNYGHFLNETINSVTSQTYKELECVVIDDGSTDNTRKIVSSLAKQDNRIRYIYQNNQGVSVARNTGIKVSRGSFIQFLDADDLIESNKLKRQVDFLECNTQFDLVYGEARYFTTENPEERRYSLWNPDRLWMPLISGSGDQLVLSLLKRNIVPINSPLTRIEIINKVGGFDTNHGMFADWDFWIRCAIAGINVKFLQAEDTFALIRMHTSSMTIYQSDKHLLEIIKLREKVTKYSLSSNALNLNREALKQDKYELATEKTFNSIDKIKNGQIFNGLIDICHSGFLSKKAVLASFKTMINKRIDKKKELYK